MQLSFCPPWAQFSVSAALQPSPAQHACSSEQHTGVRTGSARNPLQCLAQETLSAVQFSLGLGEGLSQLALALGRSSSKCLYRCVLSLAATQRLKRAFFFLGSLCKTVPYMWKFFHYSLSLNSGLVLRSRRKQKWETWWESPWWNLRLIFLELAAMTERVLNFL